jgi:hypothetical protein
VFRFSNHPAAITVSEGVGTAWNYLTVTWLRWLPVLVGVALFDAVISAYVATNVYSIVSYNQYTGELVWASNSGSRLANFAGLAFLEGAVTFGASCYYWALAIVGLRNRPLTLDWVATRGVLVLASGVLMAVVGGGAFILLLIVAIAAQGLGVLLLLAGGVALIYVGLRVTFGPLAIFDGAGPIEGLARSWDLTRGAVLRTFGWVLMGALLTLIISVVGGLLVLPFASDTSGFIPQLITSVVSGFATVLLAFMIAVLYESQLARKFPNLYPIDPRWLASQGYSAGAWGPGPSWTAGGPMPPEAFGPRWAGPGTYPPPYPPGASGAWGVPPGYPPNYPPGAVPPGAWGPPPGYPPGAVPPIAYPPIAYPPIAYPPIAYPPGPYPPGTWSPSSGAWGPPPGYPPAAPAQGSGQTPPPPAPEPPADPEPPAES